MKKLLRAIITRIKGSNFEREFQEIKNINSKEELLDFQDSYLTKLLLHANKNVLYYNTTFNDIDLIIDGKIDQSKFQKIPILTKEIMMEYHEQLISKEYTSRKWYYNYSGGSTGEPMKFIQDNRYNVWGNAINYYYFKEFHDIDREMMKKITLWGSERDLFEGSLGFKAKITNWFTNNVFLNSFRMTEKDMGRYIKAINSYQPDLIRGYAGSLYELCRYAERKNMEVYTPKILVSAAETLRDEMREKIETVFGTKLYDFYGSREVSNLAGECKEGLMHIFMFWNYVEILDNNNQPVKEGEEGKVVVTNLHNYSMPLIRYEIGDMAVLGTEKCKCGNILPTLNKITGRITDHFILQNGTTVPAEFFIHLIGVVCNTGFIKKFQVIQEEYNLIKLLVVPEGNIRDSQKKDIENKIKIVMGQDCKIIWNFVEEIPKTKSGKYLYTKSLIRSQWR